jgi:hypothetical protein
MPNNVFNHLNLNPNDISNNIGSTNFGTITGALAARVVTVGGRFSQGSRPNELDLASICQQNYDACVIGLASSGKSVKRRKDRIYELVGVLRLAFDGRLTETVRSPLLA